MNKPPLVSVLLGCYNAAPWLAATLTSVQQQTWKNLEIILVDDGSTDATFEIATQHAGPNLKVLRKVNGGQSSAFNLALSYAQGEFIEYLDADDLLHENKIATQLVRLGKLPSGWIASGAWARFRFDISEAVFTPEDVWCDLDPIEWNIRSWCGGGMMHGSAWLAPRKVVNAAGPWNENLTLINDFEYYTRLTLASCGVAFCPDARSYYRSGVSNSVSGRISKKSWESAFRAVELGTSHLLSAENSDRTRSAAAINWQRLIYSAYPYVPKLVLHGEASVQSLGGCELEIGGGNVFKILRATCGWKFARRMQVLGRSLNPSSS